MKKLFVILIFIYFATANNTIQDTNKTDTNKTFEKFLNKTKIDINNLYQYINKHYPPDNYLNHLK